MELYAILIKTESILQYSHDRARDYTLYVIRPGDRALIFLLKAEFVCPYVEKICGWDEDYQQRDFDRYFAAIGQFQGIQVNGKSTDILRQLQEVCAAQNHSIRLGCFKKNHRAKALYEKLGFSQVAETETHVLLE